MGRKGNGLSGLLPTSWFRNSLLPQRQVTLQLEKMNFLHPGAGYPALLFLTIDFHLSPPLCGSNPKLVTFPPFFSRPLRVDSKNSLVRLMNDQCFHNTFAIQS